MVDAVNGCAPASALHANALASHPAWAFVPECRAKFGRAGVYFPADMGFYDPMTVAAKDLNSTPRLQTAYVTYCGEELPHWASSHDKARAIHEVMLEQLRSDVTWRQ